MPINYKDYPANWKTEIRPAILERANNCCEVCGVENHSFIFRDGDKYEYCPDWLAVKKNKIGFYITKGDGRTNVILTIAHLDHDKHNHNVSLDRLQAMCQRCHFKYDMPRHVANRKANIKKKKLIQELF